MALERVDPISLEDCYAVDHLLRYALSAPLAKGKRVLDAASGLGFGSVLLLHQEASEVVGIDNAEEAVALSRERWPDPRLVFHAHDLEALDELALEPFNLITSFETLEHVANPDKVLHAFKNSLMEDGLVIGSVPGETDKQVTNDYHLHNFDYESLERLLKSEFTEVRIYRQQFTVGSTIEPCQNTGSQEAMQWKDGRNLTIDFGRAGKEEDTLFFMASDAALPEIELPVSASSRNAWLRLGAESRDVLKELDGFVAKYRGLFLEHGDLKVKFANMLGWGQWHFDQLHGRNPTEKEMERVAQATSQREQDLRQQVNQLTEENRALKQQLATAEDQLGDVLKEHLEKFEEASKTLGDPE
ncbi:MAG: methyltransferase domain-containing protein [Puniceicoccaceae bacterium]